MDKTEIFKNSRTSSSKTFFTRKQILVKTHVMIKNINFFSNIFLSNLNFCKNNPCLLLTVNRPFLSENIWSIKRDENIGVNCLFWQINCVWGYVDDQELMLRLQ
jgi:hypothetical protein